MVSIAEKMVLLFGSNRLAAYNARVLATSPIFYAPMVSDETNVMTDIVAGNNGSYTNVTLQNTPGPFGGLAAVL